MKNMKKLGCDLGYGCVVEASETHRICGTTWITFHSSEFLQNVQDFPPLFIRAMTFGSPILAPDLPIINEYVVEGIHGLIFTKFSSDALIRALSILCSDGRLTRIANNNASSGRLLTKNVLATECIAGYTNLLEEVLKRFAYPSKSLKGQGGQSAFTRYTADLVLGHFCIMVLFFVDLVLMFVDFIRCRRQEA